MDLDILGWASLWTTLLSPMPSGVTLASEAAEGE